MIFVAASGQETVGGALVFTSLVEIMLTFDILILGYLEQKADKM